MLISQEVDNLLAHIKCGTEEILPFSELQKKLTKSLETKQPLTIKAGFDPTAPDLHLGHILLLNKLSLFQKMGHIVHFLIGDYTAMIGDPTGKTETRPPLTKEEVEKNSQTYQEQVFKILDQKKTKITYNSHWLKEMSLTEIIDLSAKYTVARLLERDDFSKRYKLGNPISVVEFLYPLLQGYDSVAMKADIELGGTDQKFNLLVGRDIQTAFGQEPQVVITLPLLVGTDGVKKMSKSLMNYIGIQEPPMEIFGKLMSISDQLMWEYYRLLSSLTEKEVKNMKLDVESGAIHPKKAKSILSTEITTRFYDSNIAKQVYEEWNQVHDPRKRRAPRDVPILRVNPQKLKNNKMGILDAIRESGLVSSNSEARRIITSNGLHHLTDSKEEIFNDPKRELTQGEYTFRLGKRKFIKIIIP